MPSSLQKPADIAKARVAAERIRRNSLDRRVDRVVVSQAPVSLVVFSLNRLGIHVCHEHAAGATDSYIDAKGVSAFATDNAISLDLTGASVRQILDEVCKADGRYTWQHDARLKLCILKPRNGSRLNFHVRPVKDRGNPQEVLARIARNQSVTAFAPGIIRGDNNLPDIGLELARSSAIELLNEIVGQHPGMTWRFDGHVSFNYPRSPTAEAIRLEYSPLRKGRHANSDWRYEIVERTITGVPTVTVERQPVRKPTLTVAERIAIQRSDAAAVAPVARNDDIRTQEQNVVASRLAGSWKLEPALTERLTGKATALDTTLVFVADPEVKKKVPARFIEAAKKEGITIEVRMAGYLEIRGAKYPFILAAFQGNPHVFYFRERGGDPFGDSESFNVMLAPAKDRKNDLLFVGGDFNNQPFSAYSRAKSQDEK
ncbi:MAG: hypothetical protein L0211_07600 [Planctomycetaceae bacterium]|nr:hypothetical protein [Planctomycetaceae bacterium]